MMNHLWGFEQVSTNLVRGPAPVAQQSRQGEIHEFTPTGSLSRDVDGCIILDTSTLEIAKNDHSWARPLLPSGDDEDGVVEWEDKFAGGLDHWSSIRGDVRGLRSYKENSMPVTTLADYHIIFKVVGKEEKIDLFHAILWEIDKDYPLRPTLKLVDTLPCCSVCKGLIWDRAIISHEVVKKLAKQVGVQCKIRSWKHAAKCKPQPGKSVSVPISMRDWLARNGR